MSEMKEIYKKENYFISINKMDDCPGWFEELTNNSETFALLIFLPVYTYHMLGCCFGINNILENGPIKLFERKCGIEISIDVEDSEHLLVQSKYFSPREKKSKCYQFTGNQKRDARNINKIVDGFKNKIDDYISTDGEIERIKIEKKENEEKRKKECCDYYKNVVEKIGEIK